MDLKSIIETEVLESESTELSKEKKLEQIIKKKDKQIKSMESAHSLILSELKEEMMMLHSENKRLKHKIGQMHELDKFAKRVKKKEKEVEDTIWIVKRRENALDDKEYSIKIKEEKLEKQVKENNEYLDSLKTQKRELNSLIDERADEIYQREKKRLKMQIRTPLGIFIFYSVITTLLKILESNVILKDIKNFFIWIKDYILGFPTTIKNIWKYSIYKEGGITNYLNISFSLIDWIIFILRIGLIIVIILIIIGLINLAIKYYKEELSIYIIMIDLAIIVFLGDRIKQVLNINLILLFLLIYSVYLSIRFFKEE